MLSLRLPDVVDSRYFTAANTNIMAGTQLATFPGKGTLVLYVGSDVATATLTMPGQTQSGTAATIPISDSNGSIDLSKTTPYTLKGAGLTPTIALGGTVSKSFVVYHWYYD